MHPSIWNRMIKRVITKHMKEHRSTRTILRKGCRNTAGIPILLQLCDRHARSYIRIAAKQQKSQFYYSFWRSMRTILRKGCRGTAEIAILLQFRAINAHDPAEWLPRQAESAIFLQFRAIDTHDPTKGLHFRKHLPDEGRPPKKAYL